MKRSTHRLGRQPAGRAKRASVSSAAPLFYLLLICLFVFALLVATHMQQEDSERMASGGSAGLYKKLTKYLTLAGVTSLSYNSQGRGGDTADATITIAVDNKYIRHDEEFSNVVFFDWPHSSDFLGYANYKALETHLTNFDTDAYKETFNPNVISKDGSRQVRNAYTFKVLHLGPQLSQYYKYGDMISKPTFMKYAKRGYPIDVWVQGVGTGSPLLSREAPAVRAGGSIDPSVERLARWASTNSRSYYLSHLFAHCNIKSMNSIRRRQQLSIPQHVYVYMRLYNLYLFGGYYIDLSFVSSADSSSNALREAVNGYAATTYCYSTGGNAPSARQGGCKTSMIMKFPRRSAVLLCALTAFDEDHFSYSAATGTLTELNMTLPPGSHTPGTLRACLQADELYGGIRCVNAKVEQCFLTTSSKNDLDVSTDRSYYNYNTHSPRAPPDKTTIVQGLAVDAHFTYPRRLHPSVHIEAASDAYSSAYANTTINSSSSSNGGLIWLGPHAHFASWSRPEEDSLFQKAIGSSNSRLRRRHLFAECEAAPAAATASVGRCQHYSTDSIPYESVPLNLSSHPAVEQQLLQARHSCTLSFVVAGFMKAGSSYLYSLLTNHAQVIKLLRGVQFKESGCYLRDSMTPRRALSRMSCFPFVEEGDGVVYGDGTVYYSMRREVPQVLRHDNPLVKAVFIVRDPVERTASHHRYAYKAFALQGLGDINSIVAVALNGSEPLGLSRLHSLALAALSADANTPLRKQREGELLAAFFDGVHALWDAKRYRSCANIIMHSLYFPPVRHWANELGLSRVKVLSAEQLYPPWRTNSSSSGSSSSGSSSSGSSSGGSSAVYAAGDEARREAARRRLSALMVDVHAFIGVCPKKRYQLQDTDLHETHTFGRLLHSDTLSVATANRLRDFYRPFNKLLEDMLHVELGYG